MKKIITAILCLASFQTIAQKNEKVTEDVCFDEKTSVLQAQLGLGGGFGLPISVVYEKAINEKMGVGGMLGYGRYSTGITGFNYSVNNILIGGRFHYHLYTTDKIDVYGAANLGYNVASASYPSSWTLPKAKVGGVYWGINAGGRYYFSEKLAAVAELGYGISYLNLGVAMKL